MGDVRYKLAAGKRVFTVTEEKFKAMQAKHPGSFVKLGKAKDPKEVRQPARPAAPAVPASTSNNDRKGAKAPKVVSK